MTPPVGQPEHEHAPERARIDASQTSGARTMRGQEQWMMMRHTRSPRAYDGKSLRGPVIAHAPGVLASASAARSLDVCLDSRGPFIDALALFDKRTLFVLGINLCSRPC